jgi:L-asparaginase
MEEALQCGTRLPLGEDGLIDLAQGINTLSPFHCDCSGEHLGALAMCKHLGYSLLGYLNESHQIQQKFANTVSEFSAGYSQTKPTVRDRCGMPTSPVSIRLLALRIARLVKARRNDPSVKRLINAIIENPFVYTGHHRLVGELIARSKGNLIGKCGAEGVYTVAWLDSELGFAVKVADGNHRAALPVLEQAADSKRLVLPDIWDCVNSNIFASVQAASLLQADD